MTSPKITRRAALSVGAAAAATTMIPPTQAAADGASHQPVTLYNRKFGDLEIITISDGVFELGQPLVTNLGADALKAAMTDAYLDPAGGIPVSISAHIIKTGDRMVLIDTGAGAVFGPTSGNLVGAMNAVGISPDQITDLLLTHMHPDHIGGMMSDAGPVFSKAQVKVSATDFGFWTNEDIAAAAPEQAQGFFGLARGVAAAYGEQISTFEGAADLGNGISAVPTPGHTPGHTAYRLDSGANQMMIWGDMTSIASLQFRHPDAGIAFDIDGAVASATRRKMLDMVATDRMLVAGTHLPFPGFGHVEAKDDAFAWIPEEWRHS